MLLPLFLSVASAILESGVMSISSSGDLAHLSGTEDGDVPCLWPASCQLQAAIKELDMLMEQSSLSEIERKMGWTDCTAGMDPRFG